MLLFSLSKFYQRCLEPKEARCAFNYYFISFTKEFLLLVAPDCKHRAELQALGSLVLFPGTQSISYMNRHSRELQVKFCYLLFYTNTDFFYCFFFFKLRYQPALNEISNFVCLSCLDYGRLKYL